MVEYFLCARFGRALKQYMDEMKDVKRYVTSSQPAQASDRHMVVRYRRNDFIGRSVRCHLREQINTIPECMVGFDVDECKEHWGRAIVNRLISSILNFFLEEILELMTFQPKIFD